MPRKFENFIHSYVDFMKDVESPHSFLEWAAIGGVAAALQRKVSFTLGPLTFYPNLYTVLVAEPGIARKGVALGKIEEILQEAQIPLAYKSTSKAKLVKQLSEATMPIEMQEGGKVRTHSSLTVFSEEFTVFLGHKNEELMAALCNLYDCPNNYDHGTIGRGEDIIVGAWLNIIAATTPAMIQSELPISSFSGGGLASRIIMICENRPRPRQVPYYAMTAEGKEHFANLVSDIIEISRLTGNFKVTRTTHETYTDWYLALPHEPPFDPHRFRSYWSRRQNHVIKLMMIHSAARSDELILRPEDFNWAVDTIEKTERKMPLAYSGIGRDKHADLISPVMASIIRATKDEGFIFYGKLLSDFIRDTNDYELTQLIVALEKSGFIQTIATSSDTKIIWKGVEDGCS